MSEVLKEALMAALIAMVPFMMTALAALLKWVQAWMIAHTRSTWLLIIEQEAFQVVSSLAQTMAEPLKEALKDGKLSDEDKQKLKTTAIQLLKARLLGIPKELQEGLDNRISTAIESAVNQSKGGETK